MFQTTIIDTDELRPIHDWDGEYYHFLYSPISIIVQEMFSNIDVRLAD